MNSLLHKIIGIAILFLLVNVRLFSQSSQYYKIIRLIDNSTNTTNVSGGQFITFVDNLCYESDCNGRSVGHGQLHKISTNENRFITFKGFGYWGEAEYIFDLNKKYLNIITKSGSKIILKRETAPEGVTTCSYVRNNSSQSNPINLSIYQNENHYSTSNNGFPLNNQSSEGHSQVVGQSSKRKCVYCDGTGKITKEDNSTGNFGLQSRKQQCAECGKWYDAAFYTHYHVRCWHCHGTGNLN